MFEIHAVNFLPYLMHSFSGSVFMLQILELTFPSMQMLLVWNLTEIDANDPDKVLIL